ncbi:uncharacterized protein LOC143519515 isoform X2 [Brachyhypopomus gauderio]|uniref:uncharacterized protein LOC143493463 isoform X2 n=1 Tax=Brachyhypopomus gauderio TaxID=698409 RepID=UPI0040418B23
MRGSLGCAALGLHCSWRGRGWVGFPGLSLPASGLWGNVVAAFLPLLKLTPIEELFLFLMYLSVGLKQRDLGHRFFIHRTTVSRIIITWANFFTPFTGLYTLLGSMCIWMPPEVIKTHLPKEFSRYPDTQVVIDCTELRCQTPSSLLLQSEVFSTYKSHCTFKGMLGMAPHGAVTFVSALYQGSISDKEIFRQSGITSLLTPHMAIMVDKGFLVDDLVPCKVHRPAFLHKRTQMLEDDVRETQHIARLRVHVERMIRRIKENKLFDTVIPLSITGSINQIVYCGMSSLQLPEWSSCQEMGLGWWKDGLHQPISILQH